MEPEEFFKELVREFQVHLDQGHIRHRKAQGTKLWFKGDIFRFIWNGLHFLNGITEAEIEVVPIEQRQAGRYYERFDQEVVVRLKLKFTEVFFWCLAFMPIPLAIWHPLWSTLYTLIIWGVAYLANYLLAKNRFEQRLDLIVARLYKKELEKVKQAMIERVG